ncbi:MULTISPECIES: helix-turn-helix transcriptional regulator [Dokdonia]|jgi:DNA-binding NarL/FixJ family response regulator|uniref:Transcriptional regulator n=2 Tax=Dokdonia TaxID=326319 RepID=A0A0A2GTQ4_9FLAO|nr:response regulator transcription factor [Dokdonia donghaensis]ANH59258.1 transcriptional regulator RcsB [Dokdonia donghaensis DSW-1]KGO06669.1 transcriptional regulator [Dokdonia donghaensis DSW-1]
MFKKILAAEDIDNIKLGVSSILKQLKIPEVVHVEYCDEAFLEFKMAIQDNAPFDLLITDLSFKESHRKERLTSGEHLFKALKEVDPSIKVIVYSMEDHPQRFDSLWKSGLLDGYVCKDRRGLENLKEAIEQVAKGEKYISQHLADNVKQKNLVELNNYDIELLSLLADGATQDEIQHYFKSKNMKPYSRSSIEKRLRELRTEFGAKTTIHLIRLLADLRLI